MNQTRESRPSATNTETAKNKSDQDPTSITADRRVLKQARRALGAALAQGEPHPDLVVAAGLVIEANRSAYIDSFDQLGEFHRHCTESEHLSGQLVKVALLDGTEVLYLARHEGRAPLQLAASIGARFPAASTAVGNILLADMEDADIRERFSRSGAFPVWTESSVRDIDTLLRRVHEARDRGWADDENAVLPGMRGFAVRIPPIHSHESPLALGVSFFEAETSQEERGAILEDLYLLRDTLTAPFTAMRRRSAGEKLPQ